MRCGKQVPASIKRPMAQRWPFSFPPRGPINVHGRTARSRERRQVARYILVHGAWHGGWCWEEVVPRLRARGHDVRAPDLPGMGADAGSGHVATLDEWAMFIAGMARAADEPAILVGHSRGGIVISRAAELAPEAVVRLVYLAAVMPLPGQTMAALFDNTTEAHTQHAAGSITVSDDGRTSRWHERSTAIPAFYGTTPAAQAAAAFERLTPEPMSMRDAPMPLTAARYGSVARTYIHCERDESVTPDLQRAMVTAQPCATVSLDTDHSPFYSAPDALATILDAVAGRPSSRP